MDKKYNIEDRFIDLIIKSPSPESLVDNISSEMLQEMIKHDRLRLEYPLDLGNRNIRTLICRCFSLRMYGLKAEECLSYQLLKQVSTESC